MKFPRTKLRILYHEALRQRALQTVALSLLFNDAGKEELESLLKIHGHYTEGFYKRELAKAMRMLK